MLVKWIGDDGGWKIARVVRVHLPYRKDELLNTIQYFHWTLVQHSCTGELEFIDIRTTEPVPDRRD